MSDSGQDRPGSGDHGEPRMGELTFADQTARVVSVRRREDVPEAVRALGFIAARPVLVVVGGAEGLAPGGLSQLLSAVLVPNLGAVAGPLWMGVPTPG